ncbi:MAG: TIGR03761 family integrating conjugative element protein [Burkholderiaceae bacterium]|nr:TIGR03761 family integrating conjugative element protein [Burkholderiaceae bacterium]
MEALEPAPLPDRGTLDETSLGATPFPVSPDSPFADGYDIASERDELADLVSSENPDQNDPRWPRLVALRERERQLRETAHIAARHRAPGVPAQANAPSRTAKLGQLADATPDTMTLHTKDAYRLFTGRPRDEKTNLPPIPGGKRFAAVLKSIWHLSANDNPYADWILIRMYERLLAIRASLGRVIAAREEAFDLLKRKGLALSVMTSRSPKTVDLGFRSPYGYATADLIVEFDYYVRMIKTLIHKDRMSDEEGRVAIRIVGRDMRALFLEPIRWERHLLREELLPLSRGDFLPTADEKGRQRVRAAVALFGEVPRRIFTGAEAPRHSRRRVKPSDAELRLLEQASLTAAEVTRQTDTELL